MEYISVFTGLCSQWGARLLYMYIYIYSHVHTYMWPTFLSWVCYALSQMCAYYVYTYIRKNVYTHIYKCAYIHRAYIFVCRVLCSQWGARIVYMYIHIYTHVHTYIWPTFCSSGCYAHSQVHAYSMYTRGGGLGSRPKKMYGERLGDGVEYHLMKPTPRR